MKGESAVALRLEEGGAREALVAGGGLRATVGGQI